MSPGEMLVSKIVSRKELDREVILALEEFGNFEFIDLTQQAKVGEVEKSRQEKTVYAAIERVQSLVDNLGLNPETEKGSPIAIEEEDLDEIISYVEDVVHSVEPQLDSIEEKRDKIKVDLKRERNALRSASSLKILDIDVEMIGESEFTYTTVGIMPTSEIPEIRWNLQGLTGDTFSLSTTASKDGKSVCSVTVPIEQKETTQRVLRATGFDPLDVPEGFRGEPRIIAENAENHIRDLELELEELKQQMEMIEREWSKKILAAREVLLAEKNRIEAKQYLVYTENAIKVWGWIPGSAKDELREILANRLGSYFELSFERPDPEAHAAPTSLDNPDIMKPAQEVVTSYDTPSQHDVDPTKLVFLSFPIIFGLIFADLGQGFLILLIGLAAWWTKRKEMDVGDILGYLQTGSYGLITMGISAMVGGLLFGSVFGAETVIEPLWPVFTHYIDGEPNPYRSTHMLKLSIEIGAIHIMLGILLDMYNRFRHGEYRAAVTSFSYLWAYYGFVNLLFGVSYNNVSAWFSGTGTMNLWIPFLGIGYGVGDNGVYPNFPLTPMNFLLLSFIVPFVLMLVTSLPGGMESMVHSMESAIGMISHTVSYARIFALNTVHVILSGVFISLLPAIIEIPIPPLTLFGIEIVPEYFIHEGHHVAPHIPLLGALVGTFIVGLLEGLLAFMHTLRLHYVEWFSKFYHGGGSPFTPFSFERKHTVSTLSSVNQQ